MTTKAVIISAQRSGGLFLAGCLSNHPAIICPREEPFKRDAIWQEKLKLTHGELLEFLFNQPFYLVSAIRLTYDQAFNPEIQDFILSRGVKIIHLTRAVLPTVTSTLLAKDEIKRGVARHFIPGITPDFDDIEILDSTPEEVINRIKHLLKQRRNFNERFGVDHFITEYERITAGEGGAIPESEAARICGFLGIYPARMFARNQKMHKRPIESYYKNWSAIKSEILRCFPGLL